MFSARQMKNLSGSRPYIRSEPTSLHALLLAEWLEFKTLDCTLSY